MHDDPTRVRSSVWTPASDPCDLTAARNSRASISKRCWRDAKSQKRRGHRNHAAWPLKELHQKLTEYAYEIYDTLDHLALGQSPREAFDAAIAQTGNRSHRKIAYDQDFLILTMPTTRKGTAKITPGRGMKINHICYYWSEHFRNPWIDDPVAGNPVQKGSHIRFYEF